MKKILAIIFLFSIMGCASQTIMEYSKTNTIVVPNNVIQSEEEILVNYTDSISIHVQGEYITSIDKQYCYDISDLSKNQKVDFNKIALNEFNSTYQIDSNIEMSSQDDNNMLKIRMTINLVDKESNDLSLFGIYETNRTDKGYPLSKYQEYLNNYGYE